MAYEIDGQRYDYIPSSVEDVAKAKPIYEELEGWKEDISKMETYEELPENCKRYVQFHRKNLWCTCIYDLCWTRSQEQYLCS